MSIDDETYERDVEEALMAHDVELAVAVNVATNGRWFCALVAAANMVAGNPKLAVMAAVPIGLAAIVDQIVEPEVRGPAAFVTYGIAAVVAVASLLN